MTGIQIQSVMQGRSTDDLWPKEALWIFDIQSSTWHHRQTSGKLPMPHEAQALTVVDGHAYLLTMGEWHRTGPSIFQLDLKTWCWRCLPSPGRSFFMDSPLGSPTEKDTVATAVMKVHSSDL